MSLFHAERSLKYWLTNSIKISEPSFNQHPSIECIYQLHKNSFQSNEVFISDIGAFVVKKLSNVLQLRSCRDFIPRPKASQSDGIIPTLS